MANDWNWDAIDTAGTWAGLAAAAIIGFARWVTGQKKRILSEVAELREAYEDHVETMRDAHQQNHDRLVRLEEHEQNTEERLRDLRMLMENLNDKQDKQMQLLVTMSTYQRRSDPWPKTP